MLYVTDTHPFLWHLSNDDRLSKKASEIFTKAELGEATIVVPTIVLAESFYIVKKQKVEINFAEVIEKVEFASNFTTFPLDLKVIKEIQKLDKLPELHDKIVVATAQILAADLISKDDEIKKSGYVNVIW
ncbi:MAG: PIN domain-containing protein [Methanobacteriota archaeon]|nr:PIN domain-containing protein [Candidatus Hydrothermarchaeota archaeon]